VISVRSVGQDRLRGAILTLATREVALTVGDRGSYPYMSCSLGPVCGCHVWPYLSPVCAHAMFRLVARLWSLTVSEGTAKAESAAGPCPLGWQRPARQVHAAAVAVARTGVVVGAGRRRGIDRVLLGPAADPLHPRRSRGPDRPLLLGAGHHLRSGDRRAARRACRLPTEPGSLDRSAIRRAPGQPARGAGPAQAGGGSRCATPVATRAGRHEPAQRGHARGLRPAGSVLGSNDAETVAALRRC
jgi:hypothetical protein